MDYLVRRARTLAGEAVDIEIRDGVIDRIAPGGEADPAGFAPDRAFDADGRLVTPTLTEPHLHLDAALSAGEPRWNHEGTLAEGIRIWGEYKEELAVSDIIERARQCCHWLAANGVTRVRTHADTTEATLTTVQALVELRDAIEDVIDLQIVAFPQDGIYTAEPHEEWLREAIDMGVDAIGGIPHNERTREDGVKDVETAAALADRHGLLLDIHIDETDDPGSRFTEVLAKEAIERGLGERTTASHATAMHSYPNSYADKLIAMIAESGLRVVTNPPDNAVLQGRYDDYPRRRGHTRIDELQAAGVTVGLGHDSVMDPWYHYGVGDPLDAAHVLLHFAHMNGREDVETLWTMLTEANAAVFGVERYGLGPGDPGSLVVYESPDAFNALRTRADRRLVLKAGRPIARTKPSETTVSRRDRAVSVDFHR